MKGLTPPPLSFAMANEFPKPVKHRHNNGKKKKHKHTGHSKKGVRQKLPAMIIVGNNQNATLKRGLIRAANLVAGIEKSFDDGSFAAYLFYVNDLISVRKTDITQCLKKTSSISKSQVKAGDIVVLKNCKVNRDLGVITSVCKQGFFVTSYCMGRVENRFININTASKAPCKHKTRPLNGKVVGYRRVKY